MDCALKQCKHAHTQSGRKKCVNKCHVIWRSDETRRFGGGAIMLHFPPAFYLRDKERHNKFPNLGITEVNFHPPPIFPMLQNHPSERKNDLIHQPSEQMKSSEIPRSDSDNTISVSSSGFLARQSLFDLSAVSNQ